MANKKVTTITKTTVHRERVTKIRSEHIKRHNLAVKLTPLIDAYFASDNAAAERALKLFSLIEAGAAQLALNEMREVLGRHIKRGKIQEVNATHNGRINDAKNISSTAAGVGQYMLGGVTKDILMSSSDNETTLLCPKHHCSLEMRTDIVKNIDIPVCLTCENES